jgi:hypothetical protein
METEVRARSGSPKIREDDSRVTAGNVTVRETARL